jgi:hypothetical protein
MTWITPASTELDTEDLLAWREELVRTHYPQLQVVVPESVTSSTLEFRGHPVYEVRAQWRNGPDSPWPAGGPFVTRALTCDDQDRTYLIDAWLYAPGKEKYQYMIQLETILETFRCGD